ncbi:thiamine kinase [mine drainage metagenome]|uniref:Thiamine kinase n=1 Tax=mine drainage metagenome TaxID=410659 RepID=A0A1J5QIK9_9ZZZZ
MGERYPAQMNVGREYAELLDLVPALSGPRVVSELSGGLTNRNLKVDVGGRSYVARISSNESSLLAIDRDNEYQNSKRAATAGVGAPVVDYVAGRGILVIDFLPGRTYGPSDVADVSNYPRMTSALRALHSGPRFVNDFNMFDIQRRYLGVVQSNGFRLPDRYLEFLPKVAAMEKALAVLFDGTVPCNNDLLPGNFLDDNGKIHLIDYEYSGNNEACFELGNIWSEASLPAAKLEELVYEYYGGHRPEKLARARLLALLGKYGWTLWASIQASVSTIDFDFWAWGMEKYERAVAEFDGPDFAGWLDAAASIR